MKATFIYALKEPDTETIRYIGKSNNPQMRLNAHIFSSKKETCHRAVWIRALLERGLRPALEILDEVSFEHWQQWEVAYIEFFREQGFDLVNTSEGGLGGNISGRPCSRTTRKKISDAQKGCLGHNYGKKMSQEAKTALSLRMEGNTYNRGKQSSFFGKRHTKESREKNSVARKLWWERKRQEEILEEMWQ